ncbi:hypothetical protein Droror1_Dr00012677 [Drosera rotundifolia]
MFDYNTQNSPLIILFIASFLCLLYILKLFSSSSSHKKLSTSPPDQTQLPKVYPIIGSAPAFLNQEKDLLRWTSDILQSSSTSSTFVLHLPFGTRNIFTADPANVEHMLKSNFPNYPKGKDITSSLRDLLGHGIFAVDGQQWKFQRQIASHEFNTKSLRNFVERVVDTELESRLIPILAGAAKNRTVLDLQDVLKRFTFDNICRIAFGYDPEYLSESLPQAPFAVAFEQGTMITGERSRSFFPLLWKLKRALGIGSEKQLKTDAAEVKELARSIVRQKKAERGNGIHTNDESNLDLLSRFLNSGHVDEDFVVDIVISFILAGRDTTSAALTWFFWLLWKNPVVEDEIMKEIAGNIYNRENNGDHHRSVLDEVKGMEYTHAALCESMRLYPPVPSDTKQAAGDDVLPDGTKVKKGMRVTYHVYAMGRSEKIWGEGLGGVQAGEVDQSGRGRREEEIRGSGSILLSRFSGGAKGVSWERDGIPADEEDRSCCAGPIQGGSYVGRWFSTSFLARFDVGYGRCFARDNRRKVWENITIV